MESKLKSSDNKITASKFAGSKWLRGENGEKLCNKMTAGAALRALQALALKRTLPSMSLTISLAPKGAASKKQKLLA
eukprot:CAMPEP_0206576640 /NCGR_PEP_ID=MMETSP0325_2-20121206/30862_1 /ASSEMBLY_ACC=CAM_ASM_000347 /TAXON_ID=2866 /ORGANISM="Crypthecodinium cohnii, Strain Seligo" /LENGTH=76 /DNA_ID=CAMNT_0054081875 /DNA_START=58 /DNA_END=285 /DNA_ORIENTATION=-